MPDCEQLDGIKQNPIKMGNVRANWRLRHPNIMQKCGNIAKSI